jgi:hypothetical protein
MDKRFLSPLLIVEFLLAIQVVFTVWSQVGGQYHLDLMFWPWKLGVSVLAAGLIVAITGNLVRNGTVSRRAVVYIAVLIATLVVAGVITYYYHVNEPTDEDDQDDQPVRISRVIAQPSGLAER